MNKHHVFMDMLLKLQTMSKCVSTQVGAMLVNKNGGIVASGINGSPIGFTNCCDHFDKTSFDKTDHLHWSSKYEIHAEMNMLLELISKPPHVFKDLTMYTSVSPCENCIKHIAAFSKKYDDCITEVYYKTDYWRLTKQDIINNIELMNKFNIKLIKLEN